MRVCARTCIDLCLHVCLYISMCMHVCVFVCVCGKTERLSQLHTQRKEPPPKQKGLWRFKGVVFAVFIHIAHGAAQDRQ